MKMPVVAFVFAIIVTAATSIAAGDNATARTFGNNSHNSATARMCAQLSDPALAKGYQTKEEALAKLKNAIEKRVKANPEVEYGAVVVKCGDEYRIEPIAKGNKNGVLRSENNLVDNLTGESVSEIVCGMHYHPSGSLTGSIGDLVSSNTSGFEEYIVVRNPDGKGLSPDIGKLSPDGTPSVVRLNGNVEMESPNQNDILSELINDPRCQGVDIAQKIAASILQNGEVSPSIIHDPACVPKTPIAIGQFSGIIRNGLPDQTPPTSPDGGHLVPQTYTIDNRPAKAQMSELLEGTYSTCSAITAEAGCGAEYQSIVAPVMEQGRAAISSIPDRQTVTIPSDSSTR